MPRLVTLLRVDLRLLEPAHLGAPERADPADTSAPVPIARDGAGHPYVPATSLAGSFRAHVEAREGAGAHVEARAETLLGSGTDAAGDGVEVTPSAVRFLGTHVAPAAARSAETRGAAAESAPSAPATPENQTVQDASRGDAPPDPAQAPEPTLGAGRDVDERPRTAVDRFRGAAGASLLMAHEELRPGTTVAVYLRLDGERPASSRERPSAADHLLHALAAWRPFIGAGRSSGRGRTVVTAIRYGHLDLDSPSDLTTWLTRGGPDLVEHVATARRRPDPVDDSPWFTVRWRIVDGLHIGSGRSQSQGVERPGAQRRAEPARTLRSAGRPVIPGSTWKGLFRSRCAFILRSVGWPEQDLCDPGQPGGSCGGCLLCAAFGWSAARSSAEEEASESVGARGALRFLDTPILSVAADGDGERAATVVRQHVALDRFTGGARGGLLFAEEVVEDGTLALRIEKDPGRDLGDPELLQALLVLACHDIDAGHVGVGGNVTRGLGTLALRDSQQERKQSSDCSLDRDAAVRVLAARLAAGRTAHDQPNRQEVCT